MSGEKDTAYEAALNRLDRMSSRVKPQEIIDIVGVLADLKPASFVIHDDDLAGVIENLGLTYVPFGYEQGVLDLMAVSKDQEKADKLAELMVSRSTDNDEREVGRLLGYPETATEYYIKRMPTLDSLPGEQLPMIEIIHLQGTDTGWFHQIILSPDHWQEEVDNYILPLERATKQLAPNTYNRVRKDIRRKKLFDGTMKIMGIEPRPQHSAATRVEYVGHGIHFSRQG